MHPLTVPLVATSGQWLQVKLHQYGSRTIIQFSIFQGWYSSTIPICKSYLIITTLGKVPPASQRATRCWPVQVFHTLPQRMDESPQQSSLLFISDYAACVHHKWLNVHTISALLERRLVQRCCNFCQRCCLLCLNFSFERCAYLSAWHSDASPINSLFTPSFTRKHHVPSMYDITDAQLLRRTMEIPIANTVEMSQYWPILITDPIIGATIVASFSGQG